MRAHFGGDLIYGHIVEKGRHMIISAGLGTSNVPVRFMRPPEVVQLTLGGGTAPSQVRADVPLRNHRSTSFA